MRDFSEELLKMIWELRNLESLELYGEVSNRSILNDIHKLQKLKSLKISRRMSDNILDNLKFGVFHDLEELDAFFYGASLDSIREMKRITPKLKKIEIFCDSSDTINALLDTLENLESVAIRGAKWKIPSEKFYPKVKYLLALKLDSDLNAEQITTTFPNLETLIISKCSLDEEPESFLATLLSELKQLKELRMGTSHLTDLGLDREYVLQCLQEHGKHLEEVYVDFSFTESEIDTAELIIEKNPGGSYSVSGPDLSCF
jgi:hypothetical protein